MPMARATPFAPTSASVAASSKPSRRVGSNLKRATVEDVQNALEAMRTKSDGSPGSAATVNTYVAAVKALLGFAHKVGFTRFNAAPLIKLRKAPRKTAQRLLSQVELHLLLRAARSKRDRLMLEVAYFGALRVSELASLTWSQIIPRETGEAQLAIVGKGDKPRNILIPADLAAALRELRGDAPGLSAGVSDLGAAHQLHRKGDGKAGRDQSCRLCPLASPRPRQPRDRRGRAHHARVANTRTRGPEDDERLRPRQAERQFEPLSQEELTDHAYPSGPHILGGLADGALEPVALRCLLQ